VNIVDSGVAFWVQYGRSQGIQALQELFLECAEAMVAGRPVEVSYEGSRGRVEYPGDASRCGSDIAEAIRLLEGGRTSTASVMDLSCKTART
jgi:hypothetical protein